MRIVSFDYAAFFIILTIITIYFLKIKYRKDRNNKLYLIILFTVLFSTSLNIIANYFVENLTLYNVVLTRIIVTLRWLVSSYIPFLVLIYSIYVCKNYRINKKDKRNLVLILIIDNIFILTSQFTKICFYFENNVYYENNHNFLLIFLVIIEIAYTLKQYLDVKELFSIYQILSLKIVFLVQILAFILQCTVNVNISIVSFVYAISLFVLFNTIHMIQWKFDSEYGVFNQQAFIQKIDEEKYYRQDSTIIAINFKSFKIVKALFGIEESLSLIKMLSKDIGLIYDKSNIYHIEEYMFFVRTLKKDVYDKDFIKLQNITNDKKYQKYKITSQAVVSSHQKVSNSGTEFVKMISNFLISNRRTSDKLLVMEPAYWENEKKKQAILDFAKGIISNSDIDLKFQPIYNIKEDIFDSCEVLLRFNSDSYSVQDFVIICEENELVAEVDEIILNKVIDFIKNNEEKLKDVKRFDVNLSALEFVDETLSKRLLEKLASNGIKNGKISFELTETAKNIYFQNINKTIKEMRQHDIAFALDDFGTGYSSIGSLLSYDFDIIKLDKTFLKDIFKDDKRMLFFYYNVETIKEMELKICLEGVEVKEEAEVAKSLGIDFIQGYYYSKPLTPEDYLQFLFEHKKTVEV